MGDYGTPATLANQQGVLKAMQGPRMTVKAARAKKHPGFAAVEKEIARQPGIRNAGAVLAARTRAASPAAKRQNPFLKKVK